MMFLCTLRFDLQEEGLTFLMEFFSLDEIEAAKEEREDRPDQIELDLISDHEEEGTQEEGNEAQQTVSSGDELDLPVTETQTRRTSERACKRPREEDNQWSYH
jgi:hypothetical protein